MSPLISLIPLSFRTKKIEVRAFLDQISSFSSVIELIIVLENNDKLTFDIWNEELKSEQFIISNLSYIIDDSSKGSCLNRAINISNGKYIMRCDMDDNILPNRYEDTINLIRNSNYKVDFIYSDMYDLKTDALIKYPRPEYAKFYSCFKNPFPAPTSCFKKEFLIKHNIHYPKTNRCEDLYLSFKFIDNNAIIKKLNRPVVIYNNNNLVGRDYMNWLINFKYRLGRSRYDLIGLISLSLSPIFLLMGIILYLVRKIIFTLSKLI